MTTIYDTSRALTIADFRSPKLLYQATPEAIALETFLDEQIRAGGNRGSLRQGALARLWSALHSIDAALDDLALDQDGERCQSLAEDWLGAFDLWSGMARDVAQYLANMIATAQQTKPEIESYLAYKEAVVAYVQGFANALTQQSRRFRQLLTAWVQDGKRERLIATIAPRIDPPTLRVEERRPLDAMTRDVIHQVDAITAWFAAESNADTFRRNALAEVDNLLRRAMTLSAHTRAGMNYATNLNHLAHTLLRSHDGMMAQQIFAAAFANTLPVHLPENLAGLTSATTDDDQCNPWEAPPTVKLRLRPVTRGGHLDNRAEDPLPDHSVAIREMVAKQNTREQEEITRLNMLFADTIFDVGTNRSITPAERGLLLDMIDICLSDSQHIYDASDRSFIVLLNPAETAYGFLRASDGIVLLPRYRLQRFPAGVVPKEATDA